MVIGVGQRCVVRVKIADVELRNARDIVATVESPQYVAHCQEVSFDEVSGLVYVVVDVNSAGPYSMWLEVRFAKEVVYTPAFVFAEVEGEAAPCDAPYIVDVEVAGESVTVTPPKVDVDGGGGASITVDTVLSETSNNAIANSAVTKALKTKQDTLTLTTKPNGNIVIGNIARQTKEFMPATPSGDPMHYTYEAVGAVYNDTGADTTFVGVYGDTILHKANHWRLNDLGDLTNEDMLTIYTERSPMVSMPFTKTKGRTNSITNFSRFSSHSLPQAFRDSKLEVCCLFMGDEVNEKVNPTDLLYTFANCNLLRDILGILNLTDVTRVTNAFLNCHSLRNVLIYGLPRDISFAQSPLSKESLLYLINNCASGVSFTITLHPDVYAKCTDADNGEWYDDVVNAIDTAVNSKNTTITLASA